MYQPQFYISNKILVNVSEIEKSIALLTHSDITAQQTIKLKARSKTMDLFHMAHMLNAELSIKEAEKITEGKIYDQSKITSVILSNLKNLLEFTRMTLHDEYRDLDSSTLLHMNKNLLSNWKEIWDVKFRSPEEIQDKEWNDWIELIDKSIEPLTLQDELRKCFEWYKITSPKLHPLLRIAILLYRLIEISPFSYANKFTVISGADFLLLKNGYLAEDMLPTFRLFDLNNNLFIATIRRIQTLQQKDITPWIEIFTSALNDELKKLQNEVSAEVLSSNKGSSTFLDLNKRQLKILKYLQTIPTVKREDYVQMMDVSSMTAFRDLNDLVTKKLIKIQGKGRATKYMLTNR